ncbi:MAG: glutamate racemase [bacterium]|nr:glutamate racemase [bacterium]
MSANPNRPIGVFDSGLGGLTVLGELVRALPGERFIYFGDTARVPYGAKSPRIVQRYSAEVADHLLTHDIKLLVIACNTATAHAEALLRDRLAQRETPVPVIGVIEPGVAALIKRSRNQRLGVLGTRSTIKSGEYARRILERKPEAQIFSKACPLFVPLVEEGWQDKRATRLIIQEYLSEMQREEVDTVVLGCTHYPLLKSAIQSEFPGLELVDSSRETAAAVADLLQAEELQSEAAAPGAGNLRIELTDLTDQMNDLENLLAGIPVAKIEEVSLG